MTKRELIAQVAKRTGVSKEAVKRSLEALLTVIADAMARGEEVKFKGFGTFGSRARRPSQRVHLKTHQLIPVGNKVMPRFKPSKLLKKLMADNLTVVQLPSGRLTVRVRQAPAQLPHKPELKSP
jgi:DNA-binding protein HU-beta